jgi:hypothetical protein
MKNIIISDINTKNKSIIPYALNFAKFIDDKVRIIHPVDPRVHQGIASAYADSQSFEVGDKMTHEDIAEREKHQAWTSLNKLLSKEASKLNFPLRIDTIIEENSIHSLLMDEIGNGQSSCIISSTSFNGTAFYDLAEFLEITNKFNSIALVVPPGHKATTPHKLIVLYNFNSGNDDDIFKMLESLRPIKISVSIADISKQNKYHEMLVKSEAWKQAANNYFGLSNPLTTNILVGEQFTDTAVNYIRRNNYDMVAIPHNIKELTGMSKYPKNKLEELINDLALPVLLY